MKKNLKFIAGSDLTHIPNPSFDPTLPLGVINNQKYIKSSRCKKDLRENPNYNPAYPDGFLYNYPDIIDPLCVTSKLHCEHIELPMLKEDFIKEIKKTSNKKDPIKNIRVKKVLHKALLLIARHQVAPPQWLAEAIIISLSENSKNQNNKNSLKKLITRVEAQNVFFISEENLKNGISLETTAEQLDIDDFRLDRLRKYYKNFLERLYDFADKSP